MTEIEGSKNMIGQMLKQNGIGGYLSTVSYLLSIKQQIIDPILADLFYFIFFFFISSSIASLISGDFRGGMEDTLVEPALGSNDFSSTFNSEDVAF